ncbi:two-component system response regulator [Nocardioides sp. Root122]|uniref:response regulator transcription factor n=1 Tax=Nocardioides TaxID=1839 RepID=UPI0007027C78|nr:MULTISPECIES: response regulator transcription factor [Nocardioides]KQV69640.1 two-component system response regulator [Nocardioides sp. Root122]MCK9824424.1 response regulator transcription factor [Nocardioides cavernae]
MRILVVEDDKQLAAALRRGLESEGHAVDVALTGTDGEWYASENTYDAMVVDVMLPGLTGDALCARRRESGDWTPILMLTARSGPEQEARALDAGADDFLSKPFSFMVLTARLRALLRRDSRERPTVLEVGDLRLDPALHRVWRGDTLVDLTPKQFSLLEFMMRHADHTLSKTTILEHVWDFAYDGHPNIVEVYVRQLRQRIDEPFQRASLQTVRLVGYRVVDDLAQPGTARGR